MLIYAILRSEIQTTKSFFFKVGIVIAEDVPSFSLSLLLSLHLLERLTSAPTPSEKTPADCTNLEVFLLRSSSLLSESFNFGPWALLRTAL